MTNKESLEHMLKEEEGFRSEEYPDPNGKSTCIGYGHKLTENGVTVAQSPEELGAMGLEEELDDWSTLTITEEQGEALLQVDIEDAIESLESSKKYKGFTEEELEALDPERFIAIINMAFQMGGAGIRQKYPSFVKAMHAKDYNWAADEMLWSNGKVRKKHSLWYQQTPTRCQLMSDMIRHGSQSKKLLVEKETSTDISQISTAELMDELKNRLG